CLHGQAMRAGGWPEKDRQAFTKALVGTLKGDHPKQAKGFVIRQLQVAGGAEVAATLGDWLLDDELWEDAAQALLAIGDTGGQFLKALPKANGKQLLTIVQALGVLKVNNAAERLRELVTSDDATLRQVAAWSLANMADAASATALLKAADTAKGHERTKQTSSCLQLAENLNALGNKKEATRIYQHLRDTRKDPDEAYIREAAEHGLKQAD
ncbi:MAG: HEAT repeat domain-containing protein, partial [Verrucomicrobiales bacterium]